MRYLLAFAMLAFLAAPVCAATDVPDAQKQKTDTATQQKQPKVEPRAEKRKGGEKTDKGAKEGTRGGFYGPISGGKTANVELAKTQPDAASVVLNGNILSREIAPKDTYIFRDKTGEIKVKIERKLFQERVTPENEVRIMGVIQKKEGAEAEIDVKHLEVLK